MRIRPIKAAFLAIVIGFMGPASAWAQSASPPTVSRGAALAALARDVDRVESVRAVKRLQYAFAQYVEAGAWAKAAGLFANTAVLIDGDRQVSGPGDIQTYLQASLGRWGAGAHTIHLPLFMAPIASLSDDGQTAKVRWHGVTLAGALHGAAEWGGGIYENEYVRQGGVWKISRQAYHPYLAGPYKTGWHSPAAELPQVPFHFRPADLGKPVVLGVSVPAARAASGGSLGALDGRVNALRAEDAVRNLQNIYGYYLDRRMWDDVVDLYDPSGGASLVGVGDYDGPAGVRRALERDGPAGLRYGEMNDHIQADVVVEVAADGAHARARGVDLGMIGRNEGSAFWTVTDFDNLYVRKDGVWRIERTRTALRMKTNYFEGWGQSWLDDKLGASDPAPDRAGPADLPPAWTLEAATAPNAAPQAHDLAALQGGVWAAGGYDAIETLAGAYGQLLDDAQWEDLANIFATDGERDSAGGGFIRGPARIGSFSRQRYGGYNPHRSFTNLHIRTQPVIDIAPDGRTGQSRTRLFQLMTGPADAPPSKYRTGMIMTGSYEDDIVVENGAWKNKRVDLDHLVYTLDYEHGWTRIPEGTGKLLDPPLSSVAGVKFDAPGMGDTFPPFPKVGHMWFHYRNPVSGRAPQYLMPKSSLPEP